MLLAFRVKNFRSIRNEQEISLMRNRRIAAHGRGEFAGGHAVSTVVGLYGGNASGKSNVVNALKFMAYAVSSSYSSWGPDSGTLHDPFMLDDEHPERPSRFEVELSLSGTRYQYGFELDGEIVNAEWLYAFPNVRRRTWFERNAGQGEGEWYFGREFRGRNRVITELTRPNSLFLSTAAASKHEALTPLYRWFDSRLKMADHGNLNERMLFTIHQIERHKESVAQIKRLLKAADLGICDMEVRRPDIPPEQRERIVRIVKALQGSANKSEPTDEEIDKALRAYSATVELKHACMGGSSSVGLPLDRESLGTRSLLALSGPIMDALRHGVTLLVDEIDTSLHPYLVAEIVKLFKSAEHNPEQAQLIFTSHDTSLLGNLLAEEPVLERDQVWLVQKDRSGASSVYPLTDFTPRRMENLERGYLQGRYGAVPFIRSRDLIGSFVRGAEGPEDAIL